jgi:hypothetical protein
MPVLASIVLDSGCFLDPDGKYCQVGYFACADCSSDIKIFIDGEEVQNLPDPFKLGKGAIEVRHLDANSSPKAIGVSSSKFLKNQILHLERLYGQDQEPEHKSFDCVIRFASGHLRPSMLKMRDFKMARRQSDGKYKADPNGKPTPVGPIAHNVVLALTLDDKETLELVRNGTPFWSSADYKVERHIEVEIMADNTTAEKFFCHCLKDQKKQGYWVPNQGDPPPVCPQGGCGTTTL